LEQQWPVRGDRVAAATKRGYRATNQRVWGDPVWRPGRCVPVL